MKKTAQYDLAVVGGGAAGFFGAINFAAINPGSRVIILEKTPKLLSKVKISGGGRCNVTHACFEPTPLSQHYPRGQKELKKMFRAFQVTDTVEWFKKLGVSLKTEEDGRMFPASNDSQTIIDCFLMQVDLFKIEIKTHCSVENISRHADGFNVVTSDDGEMKAKKVLVAIGGHNQPQHYDWLKKLGHSIVPNIPSLFTFNDSGKKFKDLMGIAVQDVEVKIAGSKYIQQGPVLITHWGLSGPAVIKLSAWAAEYLHQINYTFTALVNWTGKMTEESLRNALGEQREKHGRKKIISNPLFSLPQRLWTRLIELAEISDSKVWSDASNKDINRLIEFLIRCPFKIQGKTTYKEEFVTCGGVDLKEIDPDTLESKKVSDLYFAGEVMNVDGETGGFNFQSAWTTAYIAANAMSKK